MAAPDFFRESSENEEDIKDLTCIQKQYKGSPKTDPTEDFTQLNENDSSRDPPKDLPTKVLTISSPHELSKDVSKTGPTEDFTHMNEVELVKDDLDDGPIEEPMHSHEDGLSNETVKNGPSKKPTHSNEDEVSKDCSEHDTTEEPIHPDEDVSKNSLGNGTTEEPILSKEDDSSKKSLEIGTIEVPIDSNEGLPKNSSEHGARQEPVDADEDELSIITPSEATKKAYPKWSRTHLSAESVPRPAKRTSTGQIKLEDNDSTQLGISLDEQRIRDARKAVVARLALGKKQSSRVQPQTDVPDITLPHRDEGLTPAEKAVKEPTLLGDGLLGKDDVRSSADDNIDYAWMHAEAIDDDEEQFQALRHKRQRLTDIQKHSKLSLADESELAQIDTRTANITRRRHVADQMETGEDGYGLFVDPIAVPDELHDGQLPYQDHANESLAFARQQGSHKRATPSSQVDVTKVKKPRQKPAKNAREVEDQRRLKDEAKAQKKKTRTAVKAAALKKSLSSPDRGKGGGGRPRAEKKKKHKSRMRNDRSENSGEGAMEDILNNLRNNDPIAERLAQGEVGQAPIIKAKTKKDQFHALMANVGDDYDTHKRKTDCAALKKASSRFGKGGVKAVAGKWLVKGMKTPLFHHQLVAVDWMITRELSPNRPQGGILADGMGLGKTFEMLATMVGNRPLPEDRQRRCKSTLLVLPASAIRQWREEIRDHVEKDIFPTVLIYKSAHELDIEVVKGCDVVLTSYSEVQSSYPHPTDEERLSWESDGGFEAWSAKAKKELGVLHQMCWYRVVLDEAHVIKNNASKTSIACQALRGTFRWALSGTPVHNRLEELFPYLRFLHADFSSSFNEFRTHFCDVKSKDAAIRLDVLLSVVMMRRTLRDKILGRPIVDLPKAHTSTIRLDFTVEERILYRILEDRFRDNINSYFAKGTANRSYGAVMVLLLRLRQCTSHPFLLEQTIRDIFTDADLEKLKDELKRCPSNQEPMCDQIQRLIGSSASLEDGGLASSSVPAVGAFGKSDFGKSFQMEEFLSKLDEQDMTKRLCGLCDDIPTDPQTTRCNHNFCKVCSDQYMHEQIAVELDDFSGLLCPTCHEVLDATSAFKPAAGLEVDDPQDDNEDLSEQQGGKKKPKKSNSGTTHKTFAGSHWFNLVSAGKLPMCPSTKLVALKIQILRWLQEAPDDKIIIFTQFRLLACIVGYMAKQENWGHIFFLGDTKQQQRQAAIHAFHTDQKVKLFIAGLKCGGQALNLTCANRVISLDLWWNHSVEQQAFGRVFRIGQQKETHFCRFIVRNTVEVRLMDLQGEKIKVVDRTMQDTGKVSGPLSITQLATLFGHLTEDEDGNMHVEADYVEGNDGSAGV